VIAVGDIINNLVPGTVFEVESLATATYAA